MTEPPDLRVRRASRSDAGAVVAIYNEASLRLVRRCGFREVGVYRSHGRLEGEWRDVVLVELLLGEAVRSAHVPRSAVAQPR
ncbi:MAG: Acetyltransferase domain [Solirubrobacteraceae bacterium]|nr:Acetyltransferase domain [Solirubrobacteraceae bacterium]